MTSEYICDMICFLSIYSGEQSASIFSCNSKEADFEIAEAIRKNIYNAKIPNENSTVEPFVTVSIGIANVVPDEEISCKYMIEAADKQLYLAKKTGRNKVCML